MTEFKDARGEANRDVAANPAGSALHQELEAAAGSIFNHLKGGTPKDLNLALIEFRDEILMLEKKRGKDVAANEQDFLRALTRRQDDLAANDKLNGFGFPNFHLTQEGEKLTMSAEIKEKNGAVEGSSYHFDWTSYTKQHPRSGDHQFTSSDFMQALEPKLASATTSEAPPAVPQAADQKAGFLQGKVDDHKINLSTGETHYPTPQMVYDGSVQSQQHIRYTGKVQVPGDEITISAQETNLPGRPTWMNVTGSNLYHSAYGYFEQVKGASERFDRPGYRVPQERFHMLQISRYDAGSAPGRPVTVPSPGAKWEVELQANPE